MGVERFLSIHPRCPEAGLSQLQPGGELKLSRSTIPVLSAVLKKRSPSGAAPAREVASGECEEVVGRVSLHGDSAGLCGTHRRRRPAYGRTPFQMWAQFQPHPVSYHKKEQVQVDRDRDQGSPLVPMPCASPLRYPSFGPARTTSHLSPRSASERDHLRRQELPWMLDRCVERSARRRAAATNF